MCQHENNEIRKNKPTELIKSTICDLTACLAALSSDPKNGLLSAGRIVQGFVKNRNLKQVGIELDALIEKGKIKDEYEKSTQFSDCLLELLSFLDGDCPDEVRFQTLKKIFLVAVTESTSDRKSLLPFEYMKLVRSMSSGEIIVMLTAYKLHVEKREPAIADPSYDQNWVTCITNHCRFEHRELVSSYKRKLMDKDILLRRDIHNQISNKGCNGLTQLGVALCKYIEEYENTRN